MNITIRKEENKDIQVIYQVVKSAFEHAEHTDGHEQDLVNELRDSDAYIPQLALVAECQGKIVGYAMFTKVMVGKETLITLAPVAVLPEMQKKGIGSMLIEEGHKIAADMGYKGSIVLGHESYYPKHGYHKASLFGIHASFEIPDQNFMAMELQQNGLKEIAGVVIYPKPFGIE